MNLYFSLTLSSYRERIAQGSNEITYTYCIILSRNVTNVCGMEERKCLVNCRMMSKRTWLPSSPGQVCEGYGSSKSYYTIPLMSMDVIGISGAWYLATVLAVLTPDRTGDRSQAHGCMDSPPCYELTPCWDCQHEQNWLLLVSWV